MGCLQAAQKRALDSAFSFDNTGRLRLDWESNPRQDSPAAASGGGSAAKVIPSHTHSSQLPMPARMASICLRVTCAERLRLSL